MPDPKLVAYLQQELQSIRVGKTQSNAEVGDKPPHRSKQSRNKIARKKTYNIDSVFQAFVDILYFLEFIRDNHEDLGEMFEEDLKDLFGYNKYYTQDEFQFSPKDFQEGHRNNSGGPLQRLVNAIVLRNPSRPIYNRESLDFRTVLITDIFIHTCIMELTQRFTEPEERNMMISDSRRFSFWANFLAKQVQARRKGANRRIGYVPYKYT
ncbi:hypothetical protein [Candidatus Nitrosocosmicus sp. T]